MYMNMNNCVEVGETLKVYANRYLKTTNEDLDITIFTNPNGLVFMNVNMMLFGIGNTEDAMLSLELPKTMIIEIKRNIRSIIDSYKYYFQEAF